MRNAHWVCKLCNGNVWKGLSALRRQRRGLWEHDDGNGTVSTALALWNGAFCENMSWSFSSETMYFGSGPTLGGHQFARVNDGKMENAPFLFWREMTIRLCLLEREGGKQRYESTRAQKQMWCCSRHRSCLCSFKREKERSPFQQQWSLLMDHEWPLIVIHPNKTKI